VHSATVAARVAFELDRDAAAVEVVRGVQVVRDVELGLGECPDAPEIIGACSCTTLPRRSTTKCASTPS
jgi:hypothetical protein